MEQNQQPQNQPPETSIQQTSEENLQPKEPKKKPVALIVAIAVIFLLAVVVGVILFMLSTNQTDSSTVTSDSAQTEQKDQQEPKNINQVMVNPADGKQIELQKATAYAVSAGDDEYFGLVEKVNDEYIRMSPTAYMDDKSLVFTGNEIHGPESASYFQISQVKSFQELTDTEIIDAINAKNGSVSDALPSGNIDYYVKDGQMQAFFFDDDSTFFARINSLEGKFLANSNYVYVLHTASPGSPQISLELAKPEQYSNLTTKTLRHWQNMKNDSQVSRAAVAYEEGS